jgi:hypothetical protein
MRAPGPEHSRQVMEVDLVIETTRWWTDPSLVSLAYGDVRGEVAIDRFMYSLACHTYLTHRAAEFLFQ